MHDVRYGSDFDVGSAFRAAVSLQQKQQYWYPTAFSHWDQREYHAIDRVVASGRFTAGEEVAACEREFADWHGMRHGIMTNSGSSANLVAVAALFHVEKNPLKRGDRAVVPALAWSTTYAPLVQHGLGLALVDCDETWNADPGDVPFVKNNPVRLVVECSILGNPAHLEELSDWADDQGSYFIEDNCESLGAVTLSFDGSPAGRCGTFGLMSTFSFFYSHQISAIEGGMVLTNDDECARLCRMLRAHGWSRDVESPRSFGEEYDFQLFGFNVRNTEMHAAVAREQLKKLPSFIEHRRANLGLFLRLTEDLPVEHPAWRGEPSPFGLQFTVRDTETRAKLASALRAAGIDCRLPTGGSFRLHEYGKPWRGQQTPNADSIHQCGMFLGNAPFDISEKIAKAVEVMKQVL